MMRRNATKHLTKDTYWYKMAMVDNVRGVINE